MSNKNIVIVTGFFYPEDTAIGLYTTQFAKHLSKENTVSVLTGFPYYPQWEIFNEYKEAPALLKEEVHNLSVYRYRQYVPSKVTMISRVRMILSFISGVYANLKHIHTADIVICVIPYTFSIWPASILAKRKKAKLWLHIQDFEFDLAFESGILGKKNFLASAFKSGVMRLERHLFNKADFISSISHQMLAKVSEKVPSATSYYFPNWVSEDAINPELYKQHSYIDPKKFTLLYSGNIGEKQDWSFFIDFAKLITDPEIEIVVVGNGGYLPTLKQLCKDINCVRFQPLVPHSELNDLLCSASIHFLFQKNDVVDTVMPSKLLGMMASERPSIVTGNHKSEVAKILIPACGFYLSDATPESILEHVIQIKNNTQQSANMGRNARKTVLEKFSQSAVLDDVTFMLNQQLEK